MSFSHTVCRGAAAWLLLAGAPLIAAEIYRHVDEQGVVSYSDQASAGAETVLLRPPLLEAALTAPQSSAQERAEARMALELEVAERLAADRLERSAARGERALLRAQLRQAEAERERASAPPVVEQRQVILAPDIRYGRGWQRRHQRQRQGPRTVWNWDQAPMAPEPLTEPRQRSTLPSR